MDKTNWLQESTSKESINSFRTRINILGYAYSDMANKTIELSKNLAKSNQTPISEFNIKKRNISTSHYNDKPCSQMNATIDSINSPTQKNFQTISRNNVQLISKRENNYNNYSNYSKSEIRKSNSSEQSRDSNKNFNNIDFLNKKTINTINICTKLSPNSKLRTNQHALRKQTKNYKISKSELFDTKFKDKTQKKNLLSKKFSKYRLFSNVENMKKRIKLNSSQKKKILQKFTSSQEKFNLYKRKKGKVFKYQKASKDKSLNINRFKHSKKKDMKKALDLFIMKCIKLNSEIKDSFFIKHRKQIDDSIKSFNKSYKILREIESYSSDKLKEMYEEKKASSNKENNEICEIIKNFRKEISNPIREAAQFEIQKFRKRLLTQNNQWRYR